MMRRCADFRYQTSAFGYSADISVWAFDKQRLACIKNRRGEGMQQTEQQKTVLVVDKHPPSQRALTRILESAKFNVLLTENAEQAMAAAPTPDAILVDIDTPEGGGLDFCQELRSDARYRF